MDVEPLVPFEPCHTSRHEARLRFLEAIETRAPDVQEHPEEGVGLFGQFGISDGNPNPLYWLAFGGVGGTGLIPGRSRDNWGVAYYYATWSPHLKDSLAPALTLRDEQGCELFYNFAVTPWLVLGADLQIISPSLASETAVFTGLRTVIRF